MKPHSWVLLGLMPGLVLLPATAFGQSTGRVGAADVYRPGQRYATPQAELDAQQAQLNQMVQTYRATHVDGTSLPAEFQQMQNSINAYRNQAGTVNSAASAAAAIPSAGRGRVQVPVGADRQTQTAGAIVNGLIDILKAQQAQRDEARAQQEAEEEAQEKRDELKAERERLEQAREAMNLAALRLRNANTANPAAAGTSAALSLPTAPPPKLAQPLLDEPLSSLLNDPEPSRAAQNPDGLSSFLGDGESGRGGHPTGPAQDDPNNLKRFLGEWGFQDTGSRGGGGSAAAANSNPGWAEAPVNAPGAATAAGVPATSAPSRSEAPTGQTPSSGVASAAPRPAASLDPFEDDPQQRAQAERRTQMEQDRASLPVDRKERLAALVSLQARYPERYRALLQEEQQAQGSPVLPDKRQPVAMLPRTIGEQAEVNAQAEREGKAAGLGSALRHDLDVARNPRAAAETVLDGIHDQLPTGEAMLLDGTRIIHRAIEGGPGLRGRIDAAIDNANLIKREISRKLAPDLEAAKKEGFDFDELFGPSPAKK